MKGSPTGDARENPLVFYPRRIWELADTHLRLAASYVHLHRIRKKVECDPQPHHDPALWIDVEAEPATNARGATPATAAA